MEVKLKFEDLTPHAQAGVLLAVNESGMEVNSPFVCTIRLWRMGNYPCSGCEYFTEGFGLITDHEEIEKPFIGCDVNMYSLTHNLCYPVRIRACSEFKLLNEDEWNKKMKGKVMARIDFNEMDEDVLREKIKELRRERMGTSRVKRSAGKRIKRSTGGPKVKKPTIKRAVIKRVDEK